MTNKKVKLLIVQGRIPHYRISLYDLLARVEWLELTVLHSGSPTRTSMTAYSEIIVKDWSVLGFHIQSSLISIVNDYDVVIGMFNIRWLTSLVVLLKRQRPKFIWWGIGFGRSDIAKLFRLWCVTRSEALIVYSEGAKEDFLEKGIGEDKVFVAPNTIKVDLSDDVIKTDIQRTNFLFVGSLQARKRLSDLLQAFAEVQDSLPQNAKIEIIGEGSEEHLLRSLAERLGISNRVRFLGKITRCEELQFYYSRALAAISPGQAGLAVLQAFGNGVPFITSRNAISGGEIENIIDGVNGYLYDNSIKQLGRLMIRLTKDKNISEQLGGNAQRYYKKYRTIDRMISVFKRSICYAIEG